MQDVEEFKNAIISLLEDNKAENINVINLEGKTSIAKYMIFASGRSAKNVGAVAENLKTSLKNDFNVVSNIEGMRQSQWVLLDAGDILIHIFHPETREYYKLEEHWNK